MSHVNLHCTELFQQLKAIQIHLKICHKAKICHKPLGLVTRGKPSYSDKLTGGTQQENLEGFPSFAHQTLVQYISRFYGPLNYSMPRFKFLCSSNWTKTILWAKSVRSFPSCRPVPQNT